MELSILSFPFHFPAVVQQQQQPPLLLLLSAVRQGDLTKRHRRRLRRRRPVFDATRCCCCVGSLWSIAFRYCTANCDGKWICRTLVCSCWCPLDLAEDGSSSSEQFAEMCDFQSLLVHQWRRRYCASHLRDAIMWLGATQTTRVNGKAEKKNYESPFSFFLK